MNNSLKIFLLIVLIIQLSLIIRFVRSNKLTMKYASLWVILIIFFFIITIFPSILFDVSKIFGFETTSNMIFLLGFFFLFYISFIITTSLSVQKARIKKLTQELSILKERVSKDGKKE